MVEEENARAGFRTDVVFPIVDKGFSDQLVFLESLVNADSGSHDREGINRVSEVVAGELEKLGMEVQLVTYEKAGNCLLAGSEKGKIILLGHMDTVFKTGTAAERPFRTKDGKAFGPGVLDMKGGISQIVFALKALKEASVDLQNEVQVILVGDEEIGHTHSNAPEIMKRRGEAAKYVFCCESGRIDGKLITGRSGVAALTVETFGRAAHSGNDYNLGVNAILELSKKIIALQSFTEPDLSLTVNTGNITGGGPVNIVPDYAKAEFDIRIRDMKKFEVFEKKVGETCTSTVNPEGRCKYRMRVEYPSMEEGRHTEVILDLIRRALKGAGKLAKECGYADPDNDIVTCSVGGGADSSHYSLLGIPVICGFGPNGQYNHTKEEYIVLEGLKERTKLLTQCIGTALMEEASY